MCLDFVWLSACLDVLWAGGVGAFMFGCVCPCVCAPMCVCVCVGGCYLTTAFEVLSWASVLKAKPDRVALSGLA